MKKIITILFLILIIPCRVNAYGDLRCFGDLNSNDEKTLKPGDSITLNMGVNGYSDTQYVSDASFSFTYNPNIFELVRDTTGSYLKVYNNWITYENTDTKVDDQTQRVKFSIGTTSKNNYFFDTNDSIIFAKVKLKVKDNAPDVSSSIYVFVNDSYYTAFEMDEDDHPKEIYDVTCSNKSIYLTVKAPEKDSNTYLKSLKVTNITLNPAFDPEITRYSVEVDFSMEKVYIAGTCAGAKCTVKGNGTRTLKVGYNSYDLVVTAEDGSTRTYNVTIERAEKGKQMAYLKSFQIEGHHLEPNFKPTTLVYDLPISSDIMTIKIYGVCEVEECTIEGDGIISLNESTRTVSVIVKTEDDTKTYTINIIREDTLSNYEPNETGSGGFTVFLWIIFICLLVIGLIYLYKKLGINVKITKTPEEKNNDKIDNSWRYK